MSALLLLEVLGVPIAVSPAEAWMKHRSGMAMESTHQYPSRPQFLCLGACQRGPRRAVVKLLHRKCTFKAHQLAKSMEVI